MPSRKPSPLPFPKPDLPISDSPDHSCQTFEYAVKIVCGQVPSKPNPEIVAPGQYFTAINIHNPATCKTVTFRWRVVVANRIGAAMGLISTQRRITLRPGESVEIDTPDILRVTQLAFSKGFVAIESACELDIVAVYTASHPPVSGKPQPLVAFLTERVPARLVCACSEDLVLNLSTGAAQWMLTSAIGLYATTPQLLTTPRPAAIVLPSAYHSTWGSQAPNAEWISVNDFGNIPNTNLPGLVPGYYTFQTCFCLCSGFEDAKIDLTMFNDDDIEIWLNKTKIGTFPRNLGNLGGQVPTLASINQGFLPGVNCLTFVVRNDDNNVPANPVGINVKATLTALRGACHDCGCGCGCSHSKVERPEKTPSQP